MAKYVPGHGYGSIYPGGLQHYERPHWATAAGRWVKRPPKPIRPKPPTRPVRQVVHDPFAPTSDAQLQARAQSQATAQTSPLLQALQQAIEARSQSGSNAIGGYTKELGGLLSNVAPQTANIYNQAIQSQSGTNQQLADRLGSFGQGLQGEVGSKLGFAGPVGQQIAGQAGQTAQGAANAGFARGAAETGMLNAHSAAAQTYGAKLPGIAGLTGLQNIKHLQQQLSQEFADKAGQISAHAQDIFSSIYQHELDMEWQKVLAKQSGQFKSAAAVADAKYKAQMMAYRQATLSWKKAQQKAQLNLRAQSQAETRAHHGVTESQGQARLSQQERNARNQNLRQNKWQVNPDGSFKYRWNKITHRRERIPIKPGKGSSSGL
jgi:hypothetical protein